MYALTMDPESLKSRASSRRTTTKATGWKCHYCNKSYVLEKPFLEHKCKGLVRLDEVKSPEGQTAYACYSEWMRLNRRSVPTIDKFMTSRMYVYFIKFANYAKRLNFNPIEFIKIIVTNYPDVDPHIWCKSNVYSLYLKAYDTKHDPLEQVATSIEFVTRSAEIYECAQRDVLHTLGVNRTVEAIRLKKLSPWFLYTSAMGISFMRSLEIDDLKLIEKIIDSTAWTQRFRENKTTVEVIREFLKDQQL